ncbi:hypothetical protein ACIBF5_15835 [Micromonospora sp. NPDC050417]|uniref:hypothetical protein n=1 Tax=Micromonospora sp. NPDC050417 TaxID=3364280 RepID=UPI0037AE5C95
MEDQIRQRESVVRPRAVLYVPDGGEQARWLQRGTDWCELRGYDLASLVLDADGSRWSGVFSELLTGNADVAVVGQRHHIPPTVPRIEVISEERLRLAAIAESGRPQRRPQLLPR